MRARDAAKAAALFGRMGGLTRSPKKAKAARLNARKGGWPSMGVVTCQMFINGREYGRPRRQRVSARTYAELLDKLKKTEPTYTAVLTMSKKTAKTLRYANTKLMASGQRRFTINVLED